MSFRIICDEHVEQQTVAYLKRDGHDAVHVETALSLSASDADIAAYAREHQRAVLTNDRNFLNIDSFPVITVLYYPDNERPAHELAAAIAEVASYHPSQADLPRTTFLTGEYFP